MILKASQRGGAKQLGLHLLKTEENEHVELHEIRGFVSDDIVGALKEAYAISQGTKCKQFLFSVSLNPPETESVGVELFEQTIDRIEKVNGLTGQPRVIVFHEKEGRRHAHAVWSRIDAESMTAVNMSLFKTKLRNISRSLYMENDWKMPRGLMDSEARDPRNYDLIEYQQAKRMGKDARDLKGTIQECWAVSDSKAAFEHALGERGMILAKGDRRGHVVVTHEGELLSVARYTGKKAKEVRAKLGEADGLQNVDEAKAQMAKDMTLAFNRHIEEARDTHSVKMAELDEQRHTLTANHQDERAKLDTAQKTRWAQETRARQERFHKGFRGLWDRITGQQAKVRKENEAHALAALKRDREQRDTIVQAQLEERRNLQSEIRHARQNQAELLVELRQDRKNSQLKLDWQPVQPIVTTPQPASFQEITNRQPPKTPPPLKEQLNREARAKPDPAKIKPAEILSPMIERPAPVEKVVPTSEPPSPAKQESSGTHGDRLQMLREEQVSPRPIERTPLSRPVQPSPEERLQILRNNRAGTEPPKDRGPEIER